MGKRPTKFKIPSNTFWIDVVPGADPPHDILLLLWQDFEDDGFGVCLGVYSSEVQAFLSNEGTAVEARSPVSRFSVITDEDGNTISVE